MRRARFDFDEDDRAAIDRNQIDLADVVAVAAGDDGVAELAEIAGCRIFAAAAKGPGSESKAAHSQAL